MSNERTISVKYSVLEKALLDAGLVRFHTDTHVAELRALLDVPACKMCGDSGWVPEPFSIRESVLECPECKPAAQPQGWPVAPWFYFVECDDPDYSGLFNHESEAQTQAKDHGGSVVKLWNVPPTWRPAKHSHAGFWQWLDSAYRDGTKGEEPRFTKYNMEVAYSAGASAEQPAPAAVLLPERREPKHYWDRFGKLTAIASVAAEEWNACLDELKRLNPSL